MNIIEQEDLIKGLPDQALFQQAQNPNSQVPQFLVVSEIQRRTDMRKRFEAAEAQPQATVTDQILMEGLGATQPAPPPQGSMPPAGMPAPPSPQLPLEGSSPLMGQGMAAGGILGFAPGGSTDSSAPLPFGFDQPLYPVERRRKQQELLDLIQQYQDEGLSYAGALAKAEEDLNAPVDDPAFYADNPATAGYVGEEPEGLPIITDEMVYGEDLISKDNSIREVLGTYPELPFGDGQPQDTTQDAGDASTVIAETEQYEAPDILNRNLVTQVGETALEGELLESQKTDSEDYLQTLLDRYESIGESRQGRIDTRRSESQDLIEEIRNEGRRDAFSAAMMQLGAGIAGGDLSGGLQRAGDVATSTNALARDAARAEQRGMRDYEEAALSGIDELGMQQSALAYEANKEATARSEDVRRWEAEHGLSKQSVEIDAAFRQAGLDMEAAKFNEDSYIGRQGLAQSIRKIDADIQANTDTTKREAMRTFTSVLDSITDLVEDLPTGTSLADRERIRDQQQRRILTALRAELGEDFYDAFMAEYTPVRDGDTPTPAGVISYENYNIDNN